MAELFTVVARAARIGTAIGMLWVSLAGADAGAAPPESDGLPSLGAFDLAGPTSELPGLASRPPLQLVWFDPSGVLSARATAVVSEEVRGIFRALGVDVAFRVASPEMTYGDSPVPEIPIILLNDDPIVARRPSRVLGLVVRNQEPSRAVWAFLENVRWTLGYDHERDLPAAGRELAFGLALGRVVAHEVIHALAPEEPHAKSGLMSHSMNRAFLLGDHAPLDARCGRAFLSGLLARSSRLPKEGPAATLASFR